MNQNVQYVTTQEPKIPEEKKVKKVEYSKEFLERQENLRKLYGDVSGQQKTLTTDGQNKKKKDQDDTGPEIMRLG